MPKPTSATPAAPGDDLQVTTKPGGHGAKPETVYDTCSEPVNAAASTLDGDAPDERA